MVKNVLSFADFSENTCPPTIFLNSSTSERLYANSPSSNSLNCLLLSEFLKVTNQGQNNLIKNVITGLVLFLTTASNSCFSMEPSPIEKHKQSTIAEAKTVVRKVFNLSNQLRFIEGLNFYSDAEDSFYVNNGTALTLNELRQSYRQIGASVEVIENKIIRWNATYISSDTVVFTLPVNLKIKLINIPEYNGKLIWTGVLQKRKGSWLIVNSHESWLNAAEVAEALTPSGN